MDDNIRKVGRLTALSSESKELDRSRLARIMYRRFRVVHILDHTLRFLRHLIHLAQRVGGRRDRLADDQVQRSRPDVK